MGLHLVGAGLGRTGTHSLKLALERLLGAPCHHMYEVVAHPEQIGVWQRAVDGGQIDWDDLLDGYAATVDWPSAAFWRELAARFPDAVVLLSTRATDGWWRSASSTIFELSDQDPPDDPVFGGQLRMVHDLFDHRFTPDWRDERAAKAAFEAHNAEVRASIAPERLAEWQPGDGWSPICAALGIAVPTEPFPHVNTTSDLRALTGLDG